MKRIEVKEMEKIAGGKMSALGYLACRGIFAGLGAVIGGPVGMAAGMTAGLVVCTASDAY